MFASPISGCYPGMRLKSGMIGIEPVGTTGSIPCTPSDEIFSARGEIDAEALRIATLPMQWTVVSPSETDHKQRIQT